ncbi:MAG: hypothetical protein LBQ64_04285 [Bacteroidales bacterium]|jgi:hypothetical protein|nr:hypothetical protein [Bacteroidales bacterium]
MTVSKSRVVLGGIIIIWLFVLLNRIHVFRTSEKTEGRVYALLSEYRSGIVFEYNGIVYNKQIENNILSNNRTTYRVLIKGKNPDRFILLNFWGFVYGTMIAAVYVTLLWLLFVQVWFEGINRFQFLWRKDHEE